MIEINASLITKMFSHGVKSDYCPQHVKTHIIDKTANFQSDAMLRGSFAESLFIGSGADGNKVESLPLTAKGKKPIDQERIETQHLVFETDKVRLNMIVIPDVNTQVLLKKYIKDIDVIIYGTLDIFPTTIKIKDGTIVPAIVDLKITGDIKSSFGMFNWSNAASLDVTQASMYSELTMDIDPYINSHISEELMTLYKKHNEYMFFYMVYDYSPKMNKKIIPVKYTTMRQMELFQAIRDTKNEIEVNERLGWKCNPTMSNCRYCALSDCASRFREEAIVKEENENYFEGFEYESI